MIIAIDGPSASGKGTLARQLAKHYGLPYLDTGTLYRAVTVAVARLGIAADEESRDDIISLIEGMSTKDVMAYTSDPSLRSDTVSNAASFIASLPEVRTHLLAMQKAFANQEGGAVLDGRDIASVIAPQAEVKIYVTATPEKRAERRLKELQSTDQTVTYQAVLTDLKARDARDQSRNVAPAIQTADAILIDNTDLSIDQAFATALQIVKDKTGQA